MTDANNIPNPRNTGRYWVTSFALLLIVFLYLSLFWGGAMKLLPAPLSQWGYALVNLLRPWWTEHVCRSWSASNRHYMLILSLDILMGLVIPAGVLLACGYKLSDVGLRRPNRLGYRIILAGVLLSIPFGLWMLYDRKLSITLTGHEMKYIRLLLCMIPEHFLICGTITAVMLPDRKLPAAVPMAAPEGSAIRRFLRWFGLAQPAEPNHNAVLAWFGLTDAELFAITASGLVFGLVHLGAVPLELALSFPGGVAVAWMTLRSQSIWPAILAHWAMNLIPYGLWLMSSG